MLISIVGAVLTQVVIRVVIQVQVVIVTKALFIPNVQVVMELACVRVVMAQKDLGKILVITQEVAANLG